jgi:hypothetical protein
MKEKVKKKTRVKGREKFIRGKVGGRRGEDEGEDKDIEKEGAGGIKVSRLLLIFPYFYSPGNHFYFVEPDKCLHESIQNNTMDGI